MVGRLLEQLALPVAGGLVVAVALTFVLVRPNLPAGGPSAAHTPGQATSTRPSPHPHATSPSPAPSATPQPTPAAAAPPGPPTATPVRLVVPAAQINAPVETVGLEQGAIGVPSQPMDAAWYNGSVSPGQPGNAILDGHLDWWTTGPAVFWHLAQVQAGDQISLVQSDGSQLTFTVTGDQVFGNNAQVPASMLTRSGPATVSLITCTGSWDAGQSEYLQRLVVNATLS